MRTYIFKFCNNNPNLKPSRYLFRMTGVFRGDRGKSRDRKQSRTWVLDFEAELEYREARLDDSCHLLCRLVRDLIHPAAPTAADRCGVLLETPTLAVYDQVTVKSAIIQSDTVLPLKYRRFISSSPPCRDSQPQQQSWRQVGCILLAE